MLCRHLQVLDRCTCGGDERKITTNFDVNHDGVLVQNMMGLPEFRSDEYLTSLDYAR